LVVNPPPPVKNKAVAFVAHGTVKLRTASAAVAPWPVEFGLRRESGVKET
jgi:hypothetical protein